MIRMLFLSILSLAYASEFVSMNILVPTIQELEIIHVNPLPEINSNDIERGYIDIEDAVTLRVKSNVKWKLSVLTDNRFLYNDSTIAISNIKVGCRDMYKSLSNKPAVLSQGQQTSEDILIISYRRQLSWDTCPPGIWKVEPKFILEALND